MPGRAGVATIEFHGASDRLARCAIGTYVYCSQFGMLSQHAESVRVPFVSTLEGWIHLANCPEQASMSMTCFCRYLHL